MSFRREPLHGSTREFELGTAVELLHLDQLDFNGLQGTIVGPLLKGRQKVKFRGRQASIKRENLRVLQPGEQPFSNVQMPGAAEASPTDLSRQSSVGKEYNKNVSYLFGMYEFERIPRWPGDGIEQRSDEMREQHVEFSRKCKRQKAFERIMGGWPCGMITQTTKRTFQSQHFTCSSSLSFMCLM